MQTKEELRIFAKNIRKELNMDDISEKILNIFLASSLYKNAKNICAYYPIGTEVKLTPMFNDTQKNFYIPKIAEKDNSMEFTKYETPTTINRFNIPESNGVSISPSEIDLIILPALMTDKNGYRLGYGGGYYDRFLSDKKIKTVKIILIPEKLLTDKLPINSFDIPANIIITEKNVIKIQ